MTGNNAEVLVTRAGAVATVTLNHPERRNALGLDMRNAIAEAFRELEIDGSVRAIVLTGGATVFAAGADLKLLVDRSAEQVEELGLAALWRPVFDCAKPVVAAVCGYALGAGCELVMMCDIVVAERSAKFGQPEARVGIMPGAGGTQRLVRLVGRHVASLMVLTGEPLGAERAFQLGLVSDLVEPGEALARAQIVAKTVADMPPRAVAAIKRVLRAGPDLPLTEALSLENREFLRLFGSADQREGMRAFLEKRIPQFTGD